MIRTLRTVKLYLFEIKSFLRMVAGGQITWADAQVGAKRLLEKAYGQDKNRSKSVR